MHNEFSKTVQSTFYPKTQKSSKGDHIPIRSLTYRKTILADENDDKKQLLSDYKFPMAASSEFLSHIIEWE